MDVLSHVLICMLISYPCSRAKLFQIHLNKYRVRINLECESDSRINILDMQFRIPDKYFAIAKEKTQKILRKCSMQKTCKTSVYSDHYNSSTKYELVIKYSCVKAENVVSFCRNSQERQYNGSVYLVQYAHSDPYTDACTCSATYSGHNYVSLTHIPTNKEFLNVRTWEKRKPLADTNFRDHVYENVRVADYPEKQELTIVNIPSESNDEDSFTLVKIEAKEENSFVRLTCEELAEYKLPEGTTLKRTHTSGTEQVVPLKSYTQLIVTFVVAVLCMIGICAFAFILYRRHMKRKIFKQSTVPSGVTGTDSESTQYSIYIDASGRLRSSYAEIGSISDYRHYICLDDISQKSLTLTVEHAPAGDQGQIHSNILGVTEQQRLSERENRSVNKPDQKHHRASGEDSSNMTSDCKDNDRGSGRPFVNICSRSTSRMISQEHYDLSGYLSLNPTERTTNASLKKWKKEIYSLEKGAREIRKNRQNAIEDYNSVGQRKVRIVVKRPCNKPLGYPYHYANNQVITFDELEVQSKPDKDKDKGHQAKDEKVSI